MSNVKIFLVAASLFLTQAGCQSAVRQYIKPECPAVTLLLTAKVFETANDVEVVLGPPEVKLIRVLPPDPESILPLFTFDFPTAAEIPSLPAGLVAYKANEPSDREMRELGSTSFEVPCENNRLNYSREFAVGKYGGKSTYGLISAFYRFAWPDAYGRWHIPPGWYQLRIDYQSLNRSPDFVCVVVSAPFRIMKETVISGPER